MNYHGEPFKWDEERRAHLRAELDAYYARLYGLSRDELRYILDPKDVYGPDFPGETFRVLKEKEEKQFGEYRTRRLVLEKWDMMETGIERVEEIIQPAMDLPIEISQRQPVPGITWIPITPASVQTKRKNWTSNYRQAVAVAWLLDNYGSNKSIPLFDVQKYSYFLQRTNLADLGIHFREFAAGPYAPSLTYQVGALAEKRSFWKVMGKTNIARGRNIKTAIDAADNVFTDMDRTLRLIERLAKLDKDDLGGLATVDYASREVYARGKAITPENIQAYFLSDWTEKADNPWFTAENITRAMNLLSEMGLFEKTRTDKNESDDVNSG